MKFTREYAATEWDGGWFCSKCEFLNHWKTKAYFPIGSHQPLCRECMLKIIEKEQEKIKK